MTQNLGKILAEKFKINEMTEAGRELFYQRVGDLIMESALNRLMIDLSEAEVSELEAKMDSLTAGDDLMSYLFEKYPHFSEIINEEVTALQEESLRVVG